MPRAEGWEGAGRGCGVVLMEGRRRAWQYMPALQSRQECRSYGRAERPPGRQALGDGGAGRSGGRAG